MCLKREKEEIKLYIYIYIYIFTSYKQLVLIGLVQMSWRPKEESSNGIFMLSFKQYLTSILYNNYKKKNPFFLLFDMIFFYLENAKIIANFTTN